MKKIILIIIIVSLNHSYAQKLYKKDLLNLEKQVYNEASKNYDINAAKNAVYRIIALEGENSTYLDSLAYIYLNEKNYLSCLKVSDKILTKRRKIRYFGNKSSFVRKFKCYKRSH